MMYPYALGSALLAFSYAISSSWLYILYFTIVSAIALSMARLLRRGFLDALFKHIAISSTLLLTTCLPDLFLSYTGLIPFTLALTYRPYEEVKPKRNLLLASTYFILAVAAFMFMISILKANPAASGLIDTILKYVWNAVPPYIVQALTLASASFLAFSKIAVIAWAVFNGLRLTLTYKASVGFLTRKYKIYFNAPLHVKHHVLFKPPVGLKEVRENPHEGCVGVSGVGKSNFEKLSLERCLKKFKNILVIDWMGEYLYLADRGFRIVDLSKEGLDLPFCKPGDIVDAASIASSGMGDLQRSLLYSILSSARDFKELIAKLDQITIKELGYTSRSAAAALSHRLKAISLELKSEQRLNPLRYLRA